MLDEIFNSIIFIMTYPQIEKHNESQHYEIMQIGDA